MGKKKNVIAPNDERAVAAIDKQQKEIEKAEKLYGDGLPFDRFRLETGIKTRTATSINMMVQNGKDYHRLKAHLPHGEFIASVERTSGKSYVWVWQCMKMAEMVVTVPQILTEVNILSVGQFRALTAFEKPVVEEYLKGGPLGDIPHDDVDTMARNELEDEARKLRKKLDNMKDSHKKTVKEMSTELETLRLRDDYRQPPTKEQIAGDTLVKMTPDYSIAIAKVNGAVREAYALVVKAEKIEGVDAQRLSEWLNQFSPDMQTFHDLTGTWTDEIDNAGPVKDWRISDLPGMVEPA
jgi:hypothetical protein